MLPQPHRLASSRRSSWLSSRTGLPPSALRRLLPLGVLPALSFPLFAQSTITWQGATGAWATSGNWSGGSAPGFSDTARFTGAGATTLSITGEQMIDTLSVTSGAPAYTFNIGGGGNSLNLFGVGIANTSANAPVFNVSNSGRLALRFSSTAGNALININAGGYLDVTDNSDLGTATVNGGGLGIYFYDQATAANATLVLNGTLDIGKTVTGTSIGSLSSSAGISLGGKNLTVGGLGASTTISGVIADDYWEGAAPGGSLTKTGAGTLTLSAANTYTGRTVIAGGTLLLENNFALGGSTLHYDNQGGSLAFGTLTSVTLGGLAGSQHLDLTNADNAAVALTVGANNASTTYSGNLSGGDGLTKIGTGALTLSGNNTYSGDTTISGGALIPGGPGAIPATSNLRLDGGVLGIGPDSPTAYTFGSGGGQVRWVSGTAGGFAAYGGDRTVTLDGGAALTWSSTANFVGNAALVLGAPTADSTLTLANAIALNGATRAVRVDDGSATVDGALSGVISGTGGLTKTGAGTLLLTGANTYTGTTTIGGGALRLGNGDALPATSNITLAGGVLELTPGGGPTSFMLGTGPGQVQWGAGGGGFSVSGWPAVSIALNGGAALTWNSGNFGTGANSALILGSTGSDGTTILNNNISLNGAARTVTVHNGSAAVDAQLGGVLGGTGNSALVKNGAGTLALSSTNTYSGATTVNGGLIRFSSVSNFGAGSITLNGGGLQWATGNTYDITTSGKLAALGSNGATFDTNGNNVTLAGVLSGTSGSLLKTGAGTLALTGNNTYRGTTTIAAGTLNASKIAVTSGNSSLGNSDSPVILGAATTAGTLHYTANANVTFSRGFTVNAGGGGFTVATAGRTATVSGPVSLAGTFTVGGAGNTSFVTNTLTGPGGLVKTGSGTLTLATGYAADYAGGTTIGAGTLQVGSGGYAGNLPGDVLNQASLIFNRVDDLAYGGVISGTGTLTQSGYGTLTLTGANTYSGDTVVTNGILALDGAGTLGNGAGRLVLSGGAFDLGGQSRALAGVTLSGGTIRNGTFSAASLDAQSGLIAANLTGASSLTKTTDGTLLLTGANTYTGSTIVQAGVLALGSAGALPATGNTRLDGGLLGLAAAGPAAFTLGTGAGQLQFTANGGFAAIGGDRTVTLNGGAPLTWGSGGFVGDGHSLILGASGSGGIITFANPIDLGAAARTMQVVFSGGARDAALTGALSGTGSLTFAGTQTYITLSGDNSYSGGTGVGSNLIFVGHDHALGTGPVSIGGGGLADDGGARTLANSIGFTAASGFSVTNGLTLDGVVSGAFGFTKTGDGPLTLNGANTHSGTTTVSQGPLVLGNNGALGTGTLALAGGSVRGDGTARALAHNVTFSGTASSISGASDLAFGSLTNAQNGNATLTVSNTGATTFSGLALAGSGSSNRTVTLSTGAGANVFINGPVTNGGTSTAGALVKTGPGTLTLNGAGSYGGATTITGGVLAVSLLADGGVNSSIGRSANTASNLIINSGALRYLGPDADTNRLLQVGQNGANATATLDASGTGALRFTNTGNVAYGTNNQTRSLVFTGSNTGANTFAPRIANNGTGVTTVVKNGAGTWVFSAANTYTGGTTVNGGTLTAGNASAFGTGSVRIDAGTLDFGGFAITNALDVRGGSLAGLANYAGTHSISGSTSYAGTVGGTITVGNGGALHTTGATFTGAITVQPGGSLTGNGSVGSLTIQSGGTLSPGNSPGLLTVNGPLTLDAGSFTNLEIAGTARGTSIGYDAFNISGVLNAGGTLSVSFIDGFVPSGPATFDFFNFTSFGGSFAQVNLPTVAGYTWDRSNLYIDGSASLIASAIPEPATFSVLAGLGMLTTAASRRRRAVR